MGFFDRIKQSLTRTKEQFVERFDEVVRRADEPAQRSRPVDVETIEALEEALISADVGVAATDRIIDTVRRRHRRGDSLRDLVKAEVLGIFAGVSSPPADGSRPRVVVYGDSFIHTYYVDADDGFAQQLENGLSRRLGSGVEVVNAGVAAYGPDQIALRMEDELPKLRPDLVVVAVFGGNDFGDLVRPNRGLRERDRRAGMRNDRSTKVRTCLRHRLAARCAT